MLFPGGFVLLAFQVGDQPRELTEVFGQSVALTFYRRQPETVAQALENAGFTRYAHLVREPDDDGVESTPQVFVIARKS